MFGVQRSLIEQHIRRIVYILQQNRITVRIYRCNIYVKLFKPLLYTVYVSLCRVVMHILAAFIIKKFELRYFVFCRRAEGFRRAAVECLQHFSYARRAGAKRYIEP